MPDEILTPQDIDPKFVYEIDTGDDERGLGIVARATQQPTEEPNMFYCYKPGAQYRPFVCTVADACRANITKKQEIGDAEKSAITSAFGENYLVI